MLVCLVYFSTLTPRSVFSRRNLVTDPQIVPHCRMSSTSMGTISACALFHYKLLIGLTSHPRSSTAHGQLHDISPRDKTMAHGDRLDPRLINNQKGEGSKPSSPQIMAALSSSDASQATLNCIPPDSPSSSKVHVVSVLYCTIALLTMMTEPAVWPKSANKASGDAEMHHNPASLSSCLVVSCKLGCYQVRSVYTALGDNLYSSQDQPHRR